MIYRDLKRDFVSDNLRPFVWRSQRPRHGVR